MATTTTKRMKIISIALVLAFPTLANAQQCLPAILAPPQVIDFRIVPVASTSISRDLVVYINDGAIVTFGEPVLTSPDRRSFIVTGNTCWGTITGPTACSVSVAARPWVHGWQDDALILPHDVPDMDPVSAVLTVYGSRRAR